MKTIGMVCCCTNCLKRDGGRFRALLLVAFLGTFGLAIGRPFEDLVICLHYMPTNLYFNYKFSLLPATTGTNLLRLVSWRISDQLVLYGYG